MNTFGIVIFDSKSSFNSFVSEDKLYIKAEGKDSELINRIKAKNNQWVRFVTDLGTPKENNTWYYVVEARFISEDVYCCTSQYLFRGDIKKISHVDIFSNEIDSFFYSQRGFVTGSLTTKPKKIFEGTLILNRKFQIEVWRLEGAYWHNRNYPASLLYGSTTIRIKGKNIELDEVVEIIDHFNLLIRFIGCSSYSGIQDIECCSNTGIGNFELLDKPKENNHDSLDDSHLHWEGNDGELEVLINSVPKITRFKRLYFLNDNEINEGDIPRICGAFEGLCDDLHINQNPNYIGFVEKMKKEMHYEELNALLKKFENQYKLGSNPDFKSSLSLFESFNGSLGSCLKYIYNDFCNFMKYSSEENFGNYFYNPTLMCDEVKRYRNKLCHGSIEHGKRSALFHLRVLQELIYFVILKYCLSFSDDTVRKILDSGFKLVNCDFVKLEDN